ncbi:MAG: energy transducer TonB [Psychroserpens sp.]|uniref:energy transducer TonB family protein n=1 Tax=Psychroserpens sp. TaxID=2020870 RepID=UPI003CA9412A
MNFIERHKAFILTVLISGILVVSLFGLSITKKAEFINESFYEVEPQTEEEIIEQERQKAQEALDNTNPKTNEALNEDEEFKEMMRNFKSMSNQPENNSKETSEEPLEATSEQPEDVMTANNSSIHSSKSYALKENERKSFDKANDILAMHSAKKDAKNEKGNAASSVSFSLSKRTKIKLPPPVYLCEISGKIVVNITVNAQGKVTDTYINSSSSSDNQCLIDTALEYASNAKFSAAERKSQIGSITYYFQGK